MLSSSRVRTAAGKWVLRSKRMMYLRVSTVYWTAGKGLLPTFWSLIGAPRVCAAHRLDRLLDEVLGARLGGCRLRLAETHQQRGGKHQSIFHATPPLLIKDMHFRSSSTIGFATL